MQTHRQIINSILDTDLYKLSMGCAVARRYPRVDVRYRFFNRGGTKFPQGFDAELKDQLESMRGIRLKQDEYDFLQSECGDYLDPFYLDFFRGFRYNPDEVTITQDGGDLQIDIEGPWYRTIYWEVPLMALISELYFKMMGNDRPMKDGAERILTESESTEKAKVKGRILLRAGAKFADFGSRRRYSRANHDNVIQGLMSGGEDSFVGTSNVHLAHKWGLKPIGTQAHEWFMVHAAKYGYRTANTVSLGRWADIYNGNLGIALTDTFTTEAFFQAFDTFHANLFQGVRHDSGDPYKFARKVISHYRSLGIDPRSKTIVFSDSLDTDLACKIHQTFSDQIKISFGIGTHFTNDVGAKPLNIVVKVTEVNVDGRWVPAIKLSDDEGKHTGDPKEIEMAKQSLGI